MMVKTDYISLTIDNSERMSEEKRGGGRRSSNRMRGVIRLDQNREQTGSMSVVHAHLVTRLSCVLIMCCMYPCFKKPVNASCNI